MDHVLSVVSPTQLPWLIMAVVLFLLLLHALPVFFYLRKTREKRFKEKLIKAHTQAVAEDVVVADGLDGFLFVDYMMQVGGKIYVINAFNKAGYVFGGEKIDEWTNVENNQTAKFNNPLAYVKMAAQALNHELSTDIFEAYVLFGQSSNFARGMPEGVLQMDSFAALLSQQEASAEAKETTSLVWGRLMVYNQMAKAAAAN